MITDSRNESKSHLLSGESPLAVDGRISFQECEDKSITESTEKRTEQDDRFRRKHHERSGPSDQDFFSAESFLESLEFIRTVYVGLTGSTLFLGELV